MQTSFLYTVLPVFAGALCLHREDFTVSYHGLIIFTQIKLINDYLDMTSSAILFLFSDCHLLSVWM